MDDGAIEEIDEDDNSLDLYDDILQPKDVNVPEVTSEECERLKEELQTALSSNKTLQLQCDILRKNISVLYSTAKNEIQRKKDQLAELQRRYDSLIFRRSKCDVAPKQPTISNEIEDKVNYRIASTDTGKFNEALIVRKTCEDNSMKSANTEDADANKLAAMHGLRKKTPNKKPINNEISSVARHQPVEDSACNPIFGSTGKTCEGKECDQSIPDTSKCDAKPSSRKSETSLIKEGSSDFYRNNRKREMTDKISRVDSKRARHSDEKETIRRKEDSPSRSTPGHRKIERYDAARSSSGSSRRRRRSRSPGREARRSRMTNDRLR